MTNQRAILEATGVIALDTFRSKFPDFFALFDGDKLAQALHAELSFVGTSEQTQKDFSVSNLVKDLERLTLNLLDRGALVFPIQRFGMTAEAEVDIAKMRVGAFGIPRGATPTRGAKPQTATAELEAPVSKWASLTQAEFDKMPARQSKSLYSTDPDFRAAVDRLAAADAASAPAGDITRRVYLAGDAGFFQEFKNGAALFADDFHLRAHMTYQEANRIIELLKSRGIDVSAYEMGNNKITDVSLKQSSAIEAGPPSAPSSSWRFEPTGLTTVGSRQRKQRPGTFVLKADNGEWVATIDDTNCVVKTVSQLSNAKAWTSRETAAQAGNSFPILVQVCHATNGQAA